MNIWAAIPTKPFDEGKSRLSAVLDARDRQALNRQFFEHTLRVALEVFPAGHILAVTRSEEARKIAQRIGIETLAEPPGGDLNAALTLASHHASRMQAEALLTLSCDLPFLAAADLQTMLEARTSRSVVIAPDTAHKGTNALLLGPPRLIEFHYGEESLVAHRRAAAKIGVSVAIVDRRGLAFDVDTPQDLKALREALVKPARIGEV